MARRRPTISPRWEFRSFGHEIANPFFPGILLPGLIFTVIMRGPGSTSGFTGITKTTTCSTALATSLCAPRSVSRPSLFFDLTLASATDVIGNALQMSFELLIEILQYGSFIGPIVGGVIAYRTCVLLKNTNAHPIQRPVGGIMTRDPAGATTPSAPHTTAMTVATATWATATRVTAKTVTATARGRPSSERPAGTRAKTNQTRRLEPWRFAAFSSRHR